MVTRTSNELCLFSNKLVIYFLDEIIRKENKSNPNTNFEHMISRNEILNVRRVTLIMDH